MTQTLKLTQIGNSVGVIIPKEMLAKLRAGKGDHLYATETPNGFEIRLRDPEFARQMEMAELVMREDRDVLALLAK